MASTTQAETPPAPVPGPSASEADPAMPVLTHSHFARRSIASRPVSQVSSKNRLSQYSVADVPSRSRPVSSVFPMYPSALPFSLVRDFAYPSSHPLHYGPPAAEPSGPPSGANTPATEQRRLSDPPTSWGEGKFMNWDPEPWAGDYYARSTDVPPIHLGDGPPWSEDDDLQSPVVSSRHRKHKSTSATYQRPPLSGNAYMDDGFYPDTNTGGYYPDQLEDGGDNEDSVSSPSFSGDQSRYSRDYQFTITSPDEEMHGKAVALYDFDRVDENELPLVEGQIILISYRHGEGWLVAEDPKTKESGLVPEEYVRLLRDIEGGIHGLNSLTAMSGERSASPNDGGTPTQAEHSSNGLSNAQMLPAINTSTVLNNGYVQPVVSTFSTSSKDLYPYPTDQLGLHAGQVPPQVVHYHGQRGGSQANTPTMTLYSETGFMRRGSVEAGSKMGEVDADGDVQLLTDAKMSPSNVHAELGRS